MRYILLLFSFFLINCNSVKNKTNSYQGTAMVYEETKNVTYITSHAAIDTIILPGHWKMIDKLKNGNRINYHYYGLENTDNKEQIELATGPFRKSGYYQPGTNIRTYTRQMAEMKIRIAKSNIEGIKNNITDIKEHITDNDTFYTFSHTEDNLFRYYLVGGRGEFQFNINYYPAIVDEKRNIDYLINLFQNIKP